MESNGFEYRRVEPRFVLHRLPQRPRYSRPTVPRLALLSYAEATTLPAPKWLIRAQAPIILRRYSKARGADDARAQAAVEAFPSYLDRMDDLIGEGTTGGPTPNAADLRLGATVMLFGSLKDLAPMLAGPPGALARRYPPMVGEVPAGTAPAEWLSAAAPEPAQWR